MGNFININYGLDYIEYINDIVISLLYHPPANTKCKILKLNYLSNVKIFFITDKKFDPNIKICVCEITPEILLSDKILIFLHGNSFDIYSSYKYLKYLSNNLGIKVLTLDYPSYGLSKGKISELTCNISLEIVMKFYSDKQSKILLVGYSLGSAIVINYASKYKWNNPIILISPFKSIPRVLYDNILLENLIVNNKYDSYIKISNTICPIKIFHGKEDKLVDISHGYDLYNKLPNKSIKPTWYENIDHNNILNKISLDDYTLILNLL